MCRYVHLPAKMNAATRVEDKQKEAAEARRLHALEMGQLTALPKGVDALIEDGDVSADAVEHNV